MAQHDRDLSADQFGEQVVLLGGGQPVQALDQRGFRFRCGVVYQPAGGLADQPVEQRWQPGAKSRITQRALIQAGGHHGGVINNQRGIEQLEGLLGCHRHQSRTLDAG